MPQMFDLPLVILFLNSPRRLPRAAASLRSAFVYLTSMGLLLLLAGFEGCAAADMVVVIVSVYFVLHVSTMK